MRQFLLLVAIYSLVFHQSQKNGKEASAEFQKEIKKTIPTLGLSSASAIAFNKIRLGSGISSGLILNEEETSARQMSKN